eukprot:CAMPEP_0178743496 /NCGR_PEP_ID=MMETSP0744-20121128/6237_1 /TAXON_ID=913974 /ORGANISM="Nitzschia punctata, Strain CCMP561" /LENGTH=668 /DNA_ID=CAMNT_0020396505 /DNA_START=121 /DNA_END=2127 /DNA_ORIENTATION=+
MNGNDTPQDTSSVSTAETGERARDLSSNKGESAESGARCLACLFKTENSEGKHVADLSNGTEKILLFQEQGKKSSFLLEPKDVKTPFYTAEKPANVIIERENRHLLNDGTFFLGGFQMISTAKNVEIFLTDKDGKEGYLTTSKGIPFNKEDTSAPWHKAICVVPGGPRPILRLRIKLLSLRPSETMTAKLKFMKITARIAEPPSPTSQSNLQAELPHAERAASPGIAPVASSRASAPSPRQRSVFFATPEAATDPHYSRTQQPVANGSVPVTQSDLGSAMAGISFLVRSTGKGIEEKVDEQTEKFNFFLSRMEQQMISVQSTLVNQQQLIQENQKVIIRQQLMIQNQGTHLRNLLKQQEDLKVRVQSLQADMSILRYQRFDSSKNSQKVKGVDSPDDDQVNDSPPPVVEEEGPAPVDDMYDFDDTVSSGIVDGPAPEYEYTYGMRGRESEIREENVHLKNLIRKTAQEMDQKPMSCGAMDATRSMACGPIPLTSNRLFSRNRMDSDKETRIEDPEAAGCRALPLPNDKIFFNGMMLSNEELLFMKSKAASRESTLKSKDTSDKVEFGGRNDNGEADDDCCVNIEVTLVDEGQHNRALAEDSSVDSSTGGNDDNDEESETVATGNIRKDDEEEQDLNPLDEKKEMDPMDSPDFEGLILDLQNHQNKYQM